MPSSSALPSTPRRYSSACPATMYSTRSRGSAMATILRSVVRPSRSRNADAHAVFFWRTVAAVHDSIDLVIIGGGLVGASLALCLQAAVRERGWRVKLIEPYSIEGNYQPSYDSRSSAISYGSKLIYEQLGIWDVLSKRAEPITFIQVSERGHGVTVNLDTKQENIPAFGYVIDNAWIGKCLLEALDTEVIHCQYDTEVRKLVPQPDGYDVILDDDEKLSANLVVLADGGRSDLRNQLGIHVKRTPYGQTAIIANVTPGCRHMGRAFERFTDRSKCGNSL